ncbi:MULTISPECIES: adenosylcobinamide-phosphate synthase CbiB [Marichromatium]|uniref:Cobalamin biosynthesis protein CobD n=1 Tax=Marichromatium gracile TaxID=1048 RepID=A0A4R4A958_MARGR|nr:adenosylcobinamide-phosphate synthase CbiB [Marichromatium gracile]MBK1710541.1 cobalamin biosynthesis protein CobD [Marichromatium gracile]MBO8087347.1 cobalamin biosynthesis protein CobD [Marichromatium sp.]TCW35452.1 adenosylcobinamide-phosphate synthase [Marichromatium gracile]
MSLNIELSLILGAVLLDALLGDPVYRLHPVRLLGGWIARSEQALFARGLDGYLGGVLHWLLVVGGALAAWWGVRLGLAALHPPLALGWDLFIAYSLLCTRDLLEHGRRVLAPLVAGDLPGARAQLAMLVGRDVEPLGTDGVTRATIESLSENLTDGVLTPLWALCLFGVPGLVVVKAVSSLDSMVGYRNERYRRFGWAGARSDDLVHWLPARLSPLVVALAAVLLREHPGLALRAAWRYHALLPSPNSGWSEAACAGALRVRLIGPVWSGGRLVTDRFLGDPTWPAALGAVDLQRALRLLGWSSVVALAFGLGFAALG